MKRILLSLSALLLILTACQQAPPPGEDPTSVIPGVIAKQVDCWNSGDIACFMEDYWHSDSLRFIGKSGITYGWKKTYDNYQKNYPDKATMGTLSLEMISLDRTGPESCFVIGRWHIQREAGDIGGYFTLLWKYMDGRWMIVADHSS